MPAPEPLHGVRIVASPGAIDGAFRGAGFGTEAIVIRIAADDAFVIGMHDPARVEIDDPHAIVEVETAFVGWWISQDEYDRRVRHHIEWEAPTPLAGTTVMAQGLIATVPMKVWCPDPEVDPRILLIVSAGLAHEAHDRLFGVHA